MQERLETEIEASACKRIFKELYVDNIKVNIMGNRGYPDRCFLLPLRPAWIEFKRAGEEPRALQAFHIVEFRRLGYDVLWTDNEHEAYLWIKRLLTTRLSEARDKNGNPAGLRWPPPRPRSWEDLDIPRGYEDSSEQANHQRGVGSRPLKSSL